MGEETVTPNPSCMKSNPSHGSHSATSPASAPHHELATQTLGSRRCCDKEMLPCSPRIPRQGCWDGVPLPHLDGGQEADPAEKNHLWDTPQSVRPAGQSPASLLGFPLFPLSTLTPANLNYPSIHPPIPLCPSVSVCVSPFPPCPGLAQRAAHWKGLHCLPCCWASACSQRQHCWGPSTLDVPSVPCLTAVTA